MNRDEVKSLEGWISLAEAMAILGMRKQALHKLLWEAEHTPFRIDDMRKVGDQPLFLINPVAVDEVKQILDRQKKEKEELRKFNQQQKELKNADTIKSPPMFPF